jgi:hypothetical protein
MTGAIFIAIEKGSNSPDWGKGGECGTRRLFLFRDSSMILSVRFYGGPQRCRQDAGVTRFRGEFGLPSW